MSILYDEKPLVISPKLARTIGLNEAIIVQQIHYWLQVHEQNGSNYYDGRYWVYNTYQQWQQQFSFWSLDTIKRTIRKMEKSGLLITGNYNKMSLDKTKWYTINYEMLEDLPDNISKEINGNSRIGQNALMDDADCPHATGQNAPSNTIEYTKNTTENTYNVNGAKLQSNVMHDSERCTMPFDSGELSNNVNDFNFGIIRKEVITACRNYEVTDSHDIENAMCVVEYYLESFKNAFGENHPFISQNAMNGVIERFFAGSDIVECDPEVYFELIDKHFSTVYENCDYNICHFMTDGIRQNRAYEIGITA